MFIAHLPVGYLLADRLARGRPDRRGLIATGLVASVLPDLDLVWFYLVNDRQNPHHDFLFHWPLFWVAVAALASLPAMLSGRRRLLPFIGVALACLSLHMVLDSIAAEIAWFAPFSDRRLELVTVPARYDGWVWNFILHWTFVLEVVICGAAAAVFVRRIKQA